MARLFVLALSRPATKTEIDLVHAYAKRHGMAAACRIVMNGNEFHFVE